jgi:hypothetical protein
MTATPHMVATAVALTALAIVGAAIPAAARDTQTPGFDTCFALSVARGSGPNKGGGTKEHSQHDAFMEQCMAGKILVNPEASPSTAKLPANTYASTVTSKRVKRDPASARR